MRQSNLRKAVCATLLAGLLPASAAYGTVVAYWDFDDSSNRTGVSSGAGALTVNYNPNDIDYQTGTTLNALDPSAPGGGGMSITFKKDAKNAEANILFAVSTLGLKNLQFSLATRRGSAGFRSNQIEYSTAGAGGPFTAFGVPYDPTETWRVVSADFRSVPALEDMSQVWVRIVLNGGANNGSNASMLIDNVQFNAEPMPEPTTVLLLALGGICLRHRRIMTR